MRTWFRVVGALILALLVAPSVSGRRAPTQFDFAGTITELSNSAVLGSLGFDVGDAFMIQFLVDPDLAADLNPLPATGLYFFPTTPVQAIVSGHAIASTGLSVLVQSDAASVPPVDFVAIGGVAPFVAPSLPPPYEAVGLVLGLSSTDLTTLQDGSFVIPTDLSPYDADRRVVLSVQNTNTSLTYFVTATLSLDEQSAEQALEELIGVVATLGGVGRGVISSLNAPLGAALSQLSRGNQLATCGALSAFQAHVAALSGGQLTSAHAAALTADARAIAGDIGCP